MSNEWKFYLQGFWACLITGNLRKFAPLVAQAKLETGNFSSGHFSTGFNAFGMHVPDPWANGGTHVEGEGTVAAYKSFYRSWRGRLAWDDRRGIDSTEWADVGEYGVLCTNAGYNTNPNYVQSWVNNYRELGWFLRLVGPPADGGRSSWLQTVWNVIWAWLVIGIIGWLLWMAWKKYRRKRKPSK